MVDHYLLRSSKKRKATVLRYELDIPEHWNVDLLKTGVFHSMSKPTVEILKTEDERYQSVLQYFFKGMSSSAAAASVKVLSIEHVQSIKSFMKYSLEAHAMMEEYGTSCFEKNKFERFLWHGTSISNVDPILVNGFDKGMIKRNIYGKGFYFARDASLAAVFAKKNVIDSFHMNAAKSKLSFVGPVECHGEETQVAMLCRVLVGRVHYANVKEHEKNVPIKGFHSTSNTKCSCLDEGGLVVSYYENYVYPEFLVFFKALPEAPVHAAQASIGGS